MTSEYVMVRCFNCGTWIRVAWPDCMERERHYCQACNGEYSKWQHQQARKAATIERICLHCGDVHVIPRNQNFLIYFYCRKPECQKARVEAAKERNRASVKRCNAVHSSTKYPDRNKPTGRMCKRCNKRRVIGVNYYCKHCDDQINAISRGFNEDALYCDVGGMDLEEFMGGEL